MSFREWLIVLWFSVQVLWAGFVYGIVQRERRYMHTYPHIHYGIRTYHAWKNNGKYHIDPNFLRTKLQIGLILLYCMYTLYTCINKRILLSEGSDKEAYHSNDTPSGRSVHHIVHSPHHLALFVRMFVCSSSWSVWILASGKVLIVIQSVYKVQIFLDCENAWKLLD